MICLLSFFSIPLIVLPWFTLKKKTNAQTLEKCLEENTAAGSSYEKTVQMGRAKSCSEAEGQPLQLDLNYRCASSLWAALFVLQGAARGVSVFLLLWSTEIKELPLPKWTVLLVLSILPFQQGCPSPVNTDMILSLWMNRSVWFSTFIYNWAFVQMISIVLMLLITADHTAFQQQPEPLLTWKADDAVVYMEWEVWTRNEQETEDQVPSLVLEIVVNFWEQLQVQHL